MQSDHLIPDRWRSRSQPFKGSRITIPKRSPAELPGIIFHPPGNSIWQFYLAILSGNSIWQLINILIIWHIPGIINISPTYISLKIFTGLPFPETTNKAVFSVKLSTPPRGPNLSILVVEVQDLHDLNKTDHGFQGDHLSNKKSILEFPYGEIRTKNMLIS